MLIKTAEFLQSNTDIEKLPSGNKPEYAFIGRSNVGKSSLINMLMQRKQLAKTSSKPGKTITINHFIINGEWYIVDLPGYGFAQRSQKERDNWKKMLNDYMLQRRNLVVVFVLVDSRIEPQKMDIEFINWLGENNVPFNIVFTKTDKLSMAAVDRNVESFKQKLLEQWEELPTIFLTSSEKGIGRDEILDSIENYNKL